MRDKWLIILLVSASLFLFTSAYSMTFDFNDGTNQGWTYQIIAADTDTTPTTTRTIDPGGLTGWINTNNYPNPIGADPVDNNGSAYISFLGTNLFPLLTLDDNFVIVSFNSPDLSAMADWQNVDSYSAQISPSFSAFGGNLYANLYITVYDNIAGVDRVFFNGTATPIAEDVWNENAYTNIIDTLAAEAVTNYTVKGVRADIWMDQLPFGEGTISLDQVKPSSRSVPEPGTLLLLGSGIPGLLLFRKKKTD